MTGGESWRCDWGARVGGLTGGARVGGVTGGRELEV